MNTNELTKRATVRELVAAFQAAESAVRVHFQALSEAEAAVNAAFGAEKGIYRSIRISATGENYRSDFQDVETAIDVMRQGAWMTIIERMELRRVMSSGAYDELLKEVHSKKSPPITDDTLNAFVLQYATNLPKIFEAAVREVFEWLRPRGGKYKTNSEFEVPKKVVLGYIVEPKNPHWTPSKYSIRFGAQQQLIALENVMNGLDGKGVIAKDQNAELERAIRACPYGQGSGETPLFAFKVFENGNMHLTFKRDDLLTKFNQIAGGNRLHK